MPFSIKTFVQNICLFTFLLLATLVVDGKEKLASPHKSSEGKSSVPTLHVPWVYRNHPMLSRPALPLSLNPIRFTLYASKQTIAAGEEVEITITAQLLDIPSSAFFIFEDQKSFSLKLLLPQGFTQTGGDYQEFIGGKLSTPNSIFTKRIRGVFASVPENPCFVLLRGAYNANSSSVFEQKQVLCLASKNTTQATRVANCVSPVLRSITPQTICYGGAFYMINTSVTNGVEVYYQWYNDNGSANNNTNSIAGENRANLRSFPTEPGIYKYKVVATSSENSACTASQSVTLTINAPPTITSTTGTNPNCAPSYGGTIAVTGAGGTTFVYSKDNGGNWVDLTGNNSQNEITRNTMLQSLQKDVAKVKITLEEGFGLLPGGEYIGEIRNESSPPTFEGLAAGTYAIRVKNENGCVSAPTAVTLTNPNAPAIFNVTGGGACFTNGAPIQLSGSSTGINYYLLRNEVAVTGAIAGTGGVLSFGNYATEGTYTVLATNATTGCSAQMANTAVVSSGIPSAPTVDNEPTTVCAGQQVVLTTQSSCAGTLVWSPSGGTLSNDNKNYTVSPSANTSYSVKCQVNDCVSEASNSVAVTVTTLAAPSIAGESTRTLCPDTPVTLVASGCPSAVSWSYSLSSGAAGTLAATGSTLELTFTNSGIAAWNTGDVLSVRATCTSLTCNSQPSEAVEITKQASCTISTALADCAFYIKAADGQGTETTKLTRTGAGGSTFQPLTLSAQTLEGTFPTGVTYSWTGPGITTPLTTAQISATQVGEYKLVLTPPSGGGGLRVCELYITLSGAPCTIPTSAACGIPANITPSDQGGPYLTSLAPGDQFTANDYVITVTSVIITPIGGGGASFSGEGYARMKLTNGFSIDVPVVFGQANGSGTTTTVTPIKLNTCYQLVEGTVFTQYDPSWGNIADVDETVEDLKGLINELSDLLSVYTGTQAEKDKINQALAKIESQAANDANLPDDNKTQFELLWPKVISDWEQAQQCTPSGGGNLRIAATSSNDDPSVCVKNFNDSYQQAVNVLEPSAVAECATTPPQISSSDKEGQKKVQPGLTTTTMVPLDCSTAYYYFNGATPKMLSWTYWTGTNNAVTNWNSGWYKKDEYIKRIKPVIEALGIISGDVSILSTNAETAFINAIALLDEFESNRTNKIDNAQFYKNISPEYGAICRELSIKKNGNGSVQPVYIEFDILAFAPVGTLRAVINLGLQKIANAGTAATTAFLAKISNTSTQKAYIAWQINQATKVPLAKINPQGYLTDMQWLTQQANRGQIVREFSAVPHISSTNTQSVGNVTLRNVGGQIVASNTTTLLSQVLPSRAVNVTASFSVSTIRGSGSRLLLNPNDVNSIFRFVISTENNRYADLCEAAVEDALKTMHPGYEKLTSIYNTSGNGIDILLTKFRVNNGVRELEEMIAVEVKSKRIGDPNDITTGFFETQSNRITLGTGYGGRQMDQQWLLGVIQAMKNNGLTTNATLIEKAIVDGTLHKYLAGVDKSGTSYIIKLN
ncbi:MAG TPA: hypothetical protein DCM71_01200 [Runella sp.]|nr:hypothetical protein [Runella sp.]